MKKVFLLMLIFVLICFLLPVIFTKKAVGKAIANEAASVTIEEQNVSNANTLVKLLHTETNIIEELNMNEYLYRSCCSRDASKF